MTEIRKFMPLILIGIALILMFSMCGTYNKTVSKDEAVKSAWSQVENQYQRRSDLIPNLVNTVKGYANFEQSTLQAVVEARAKATSVTVRPDNLSPEAIKEFEQAQGAVSQTLGRLMMISENYPDLKANVNFMDLQKQLEGTENRIATERGRFNESVKDFNGHIRRFPNNLISGMFGFSQKGYFQSAAGSDKAPEVKF